MSSINLGNNINWNFIYDIAKTALLAKTTNKKSLMLVNDVGNSLSDVIFGESTDPDVHVFTDWDTDGNGKLRQTQETETLTQCALKMIFTEKQPDGYGTHVYEFVGEKDVAVRRLSLFMDLSLALLNLKSRVASQANKQDLANSEIIASIADLSVSEDPSDPTTTHVKFKIKTNDQNLTPLNVL